MDWARIDRLAAAYLSQGSQFAQALVNDSSVLRRIIPR